ncbi:HEAT repeat domain-containing protein [Nocardiopsis baichengensis]|uniref:HEAT repeat domain-containing protein n=1 Tax=Nocardiopsis baichengensis TaxID=280240 RepID=UPI00034CB49F|nr:HEAT repeat domain-containing protein [Nocardiopsis baichengensis]
MPQGSPDSPDHDAPPRAYLSSSFTDLEECRAAAGRALHRLSFQAVEMETYTADGRPPADKCRADVRSCDVYIGIFAWSYGSAPEGEERSFTELEYREAEESGIPCLIFLHDEDAPWPPKHFDRGEDQERIKRLRDELCEKYTCSFFSDAAHLETLVTAAASNWFRDHRPEEADPAVLAVPEWDAYRRRLIQEYGRLDLEALTPPELEDYLQIRLRNVFVEPKVRESLSRPELPKELWRKLEESSELSPADLPQGLEARRLAEVGRSHRDRIAQPVFTVLAGPAGRRCVLLGDPGSGKSTLARYLALSLAEGDPADGLERLDGMQPLLIELRDYALHRSKYGTFGAYLEYRAESDGLGVPGPALRAHLEEGRVLVVFDGLDELFDPRDREAVARQIAHFADVNPRVHTVVTSRIIGYQPRILDDAGFRHYTIDDFDHERVERFLDAWYGLALSDRPRTASQRRERLTKAIKETPAIRDLAGNPLLLTILAIIGKHQELPRERSEVYDHAAGVLVHHWDVNKHLSDARISAAPVRVKDKKELLRRLAYRMQQGSSGAAGNYIWGDDLEEEILGFLQERYEYPRHEAAPMAEAMIGQLRVRNFVLARYGPRIYGFVHRALLEYFCAAAIVSRFEKAQVLSEEELRELFATRWEDASWAEVLRLVAGMVHSSVADRLIRHLLTDCPPHRTPVLERPAAGAVALAVQCLAEAQTLGLCKEAAVQAQEGLIRLLETPHTSAGLPHGEPISDKVLPAARSLGNAWPGRERFWQWYRAEGQYVLTSPGADLAARIAAAVHPDRPDVREALVGIAVDNHIPEQRAACLQAVAETWPEADGVKALTLSLLQDPDPDVRSTAVTVSAEHFADGDDGAVREALYTMRTDVWVKVQEAALRALATRWTHHPDTLPALLESLAGLKTPDRSDVLDLALAHFSDCGDLRTAAFALLRDHSWTVRQRTLRTLTTHWPEAEDTYQAVRFCLRDPDFDVRATALEALATRWTEDEDTRLVVKDALRDPHATVRTAAVEALVKYWPGTDETPGALEAAARDPQGTVRLAALVSGAEATGGPQAVLALLREECRSPQASRRAAALDALMARAPVSDDVRDVALTAARDPDFSVRGKALNVLAERWPNDLPTADVVACATRDADIPVRRSAIEAMVTRFSGHEAIPEILIAASHDRFGQIRKLAAEAYAVRWPSVPGSEEAGHRALHDPDARTRSVALQLHAARQETRETASAALAYDQAWDVRERTVVAALTGRGGEALDESPAESEPWLRAQLLRAWARGAGTGGLQVAGDRSPREVRDVLTRALMSSSSDTRVAALGIMAVQRRAFPDHVLVPLADEASRDADARVRLNALWVLLVRGAGRDECAQAVRRALADPDDDVWREAFFAALSGGLPEEEVRRVVLAALRSPGPVDRFSVVQAVGARWREHPETFPWVVGSLSHPDQGVRRSATGLLCTVWPEIPETAPAVRKAARDPVDSVRREAVQAMPRLLGLPAYVEVRPWPDADVPYTYPSGKEPAGVLSGESALPPVTISEAIATTRTSDPALCLQALWALARHWPEEPEARAAAERLLHHRHIEVRRTALHFLTTTWGEEPGTRSRLQAVLATDSLPGSIVAPAIVARWPESPEAVEAALWHIRRYGYGEQQDIAAIAGHQPDRLEEIRRALCELAEAPPQERAHQQILDSLRVSWPTHPDTRRLIEDATAHPDPATRRRAVEASAVGSGIGDVSALRRQARGDPEAEVRAEARFHLALRDPAPEEDSVSPVHGADSADPLERQDAVARWFLRQDEPEAGAVLRELLSDSDPGVRCAAVRQTARMHSGEADTFDVLRSASLDADPAVRVAAVRELARYAPTDARTIDVLGRAVSDPRQAVRSEAVQALAVGCGDEQAALSHLRTTLDDPDETVRDDTVEALELRGLIGEEGRRRSLFAPESSNGRIDLRCWIRSLGLEKRDLAPLLAEAVGGDEDDSRLRAVVALATQWGDHPEAGAYFLNAAADGDAITRRIALGALASFQPHLLPAGSVAHRARTDPSPLVREWAVDHLLLQPDQHEPPDAVIEACADEVPRVRRAALEYAVTRWPSAPRIRRAVAEALDDPSLLVVEIAVSAAHRRWRKEPEIRTSMERIAAREGVPPEFVKWWQWVSSSVADP